MTENKHFCRRKYKPLLDILKTEGHDNGSIFYLKIDIEGSEISGNYLLFIH